MDAPTPRSVSLLDEVAAEDVQTGALALWYTGGAGYVVKSPNVTILIDPFLGHGNPPDWVRAIPPAF